MIDSLVGFGDSWIYGSGIGSVEPNDSFRLYNCILGQIGANLNLSTDNRGRPGSSLTSMLWEFSRWVQTVNNPKNHLILVGLTYDWRDSWWPSDQTSKLDTMDGPFYVELNRFKYNNNPLEGWADFAKFFLLNSNHTDLNAMRYWQTVNFLDSYCFKYNIPLIQINVGHPTKAVIVDSLCDPDSCMEKMLQDEEQRTRISLHANDKHPNVVGAKFLADKITKEILNRGLLNK